MGFFFLLNLEKVYSVAFIISPSVFTSLSVCLSVDMLSHEAHSIGAGASALVGSIM